MTRLAVAAAVFASSLVGYTHTDTPNVTGVAAPAHRPVVHRASRGVRRQPLRRHRRRPHARSWVLLVTTAYCATGSRNAAGRWPTIGTAAANAYPLGTRLLVEGVGVVTVEDRSAVGSTDLDLFMGAGAACAAAATRFGRRTLRVAVVA